MTLKRKIGIVLIVLIVLVFGFGVFCKFYFSGTLDNTSVTEKDSRYSINHTMSKGKAPELSMFVSKTNLSNSSVMVKITINSSESNANYNIKNLIADLQFNGDIICDFFSVENSNYQAFGAKGKDNKISTSTSPSTDGYCDIVLVLDNVANETIDLDLTYDICGSGLYLFSKTEPVNQKISFSAM